MYKKILEKLKDKRLLVVIILLFFAVNFFIITSTFSEKTSSSIWDGTVAKKFKNGSGSVDDPYIINTGSELAYFFSIINGDESGEYFNKFYSLTNNINLNGKEFSFAQDGKSFSGVFDGNGYSIFNFKISNYYLSDEEKLANLSLFDSTYSANIKNINFSDITFIAEEKDIIGQNNVKSTNSSEEYNASNLENTNEETTNTSDTNNDNEIKTEQNSNEVTESKESDNKTTENIETENKDNNSSNNETPASTETKEETETNTETKTDDVVTDNKTEVDENNNAESNTTDNNIENAEPGSTEDENTENTDTSDEVITNNVENITIALIKNAESSKIENINLYNISVNYEGKEENAKTSLFILNDKGNNTIKNIHVNGNSSINDTTGLIKIYGDSQVENIVYNINGLDLIEDYNVKNDLLFRYEIKNNKVSFYNNYPSSSIVGILNDNSDFEWKLEDNKFRIVNNGKDDTVPTKAKAKKMVRNAPSAHDSGIEGSVVYVNDYLNDANYYDGLNYTYSSDGSIPTTTKKNIYNDTNLVYTEVHYHGSDIEGNYTGTISVSETQNEIVYYKIYEVNNNGTSGNTSDDYVLIDLIDNPFERRPNNKTFNGWVTNYSGALITLDMNIYTRQVKIPVTYSGSNPANINIDIYASWADGKITTYSSWTAAQNALDSSGYHTISSTENIYEDITNYYTRQTVRNGRAYPDGSVNSSGQPLTGNCQAFWGNCTCYVPATGSYDPNTTYYELTNYGMDYHTIQVIGTNYINEVPVGQSIAGFYRKITIPNSGNLAGYYNSDGNLQTSGRCNTYGGCNNYYELIQYYDSNNNVEVVVSGTNYYYLTTRDTNVIVMSGTSNSTWTNNQTKPFTVTGLNNGNDYSGSNTWDVRNTYIICSEDTRIDNIKIRSVDTVDGESAPSSGNNGRPSYGSIYGGYNNLKIGRGLKQYNSTTTNFGYIAGGNNSSTGTSRTNLTKYRLIVESGLYNDGSTSTPSNSSSKTLYVEATATYGCDYDRVSTDANKNNRLIYRHTISGSWSGNNYGASSTSSLFTTIVKSGSFGTNKYDEATGIYVGGRGYGTQYSARTAIIEGGYIYNLLGGPLASSTLKTLNNAFIYMKGGEVDLIVGGAGVSETYGNRIIQVTGGRVNYAVLGGSNGVDGSNGDGTLDADSYVYIGGNAVIGNPTLVQNNSIESYSKVEAGSVFGIGNGKEGQSSIGTVNNSNVVIDGNCTINKNVYGGGNFGATGQNGSNNTYNTNIVINGGEIKGSVYGGGNNNGAGSSNNTTNIYITMNDGEVYGSVYGGSRTKGEVYGSTNVNIINGKVYTDVYGGGEGANTFVRNNVGVTIGDSTSGPNINGSVYGGSAFGTVNALSTTASSNSNTVNVTVNNGTILKSVFGGAKGSSSATPYVKGNITVDINGGTITNVFGGFDEAGKPEGTDTVYIDGGTVTNAYGGGNKTSIDETNIYLRGGTVTTLYGGSNQLGDVIETNVHIQNGIVSTVFGGNNEGGTCTTTNVDVTGATVNTAIYGGGNLVNTTTTNVNISKTGNTIPNVFGGGNNAGSTTTNVTLASGSGPINITNVYGGSNETGVVTTSNVNVNNGTVTNVFGGNNAGGNTTNSNVNQTAGTITTIYGGGNEAETGTNIVTITGGTTTTVFGGGNEATSSNSTVTISGGTLTTVYGGGNKAGITNNTNVTISNGTINSVVYGGGNEGNVGGSTTVTITNTTNTIPNVYGGGNQAGANTTNVTLNNTAKATNVYGGSNQAGNVSVSNVNINNGTVTTLYGGNNAGGKTTTTNIAVSAGQVTTIFGGGNQAEAEDTHVTINGGQTPTVYGGGNKATVDTTEVIVNDGTLTTIFGGGNEAYVNEETNVTVHNATSTISNIYGGGNHAGAASTNITLEATDATSVINVTNVFGGSNESGNVDTSNVVISNGQVGSVYGGNNAGGKTLSTSVKINNGTIANVYGGGNRAISDKSSVFMRNGTVNNIYAGGNAAGITNDTSLLIQGGTVINNVYGGGNEGSVGTNTSVLINNANINGSAYAGGNGSTATVYGNTSITVGGTTVIGTPSCSVLSTCSVFGGGNAATTGSENVNNSTALVNIAGATVYGNVYGGANTSKVYGQTSVNIGADVAVGNNVQRGDVSIKGTVFGGGEANASGSDEYDWTFVSVTKAIDVNINGHNYENFEILGSIFGSGNASTTTGTSQITIKNYGTYDNPKKNISIQRTDLLVLNNSSILLIGATDRENEYSDVLFSLSRIDELDLTNNSTLYLETGANLLQEFKSLTSNGSVAQVTINENNKTVTKNVDNRIYMYTGKNLNIAKNQNITDYGEVTGMTFFGMYKYNSNGTINTGIYDKYDYDDTLDWGDVFENVSSYVLGLHKTNHDIEVDGFYTNYMDEATSKNIVNYIEPTPPTGPLYMWTIGAGVIEYEIELVASKYSTLGTIELSLRDFTDPNTSFEIQGFDFSELDPDISLVDKNSIKKIAPTDAEANTVMGLSMQTSNIGWLSNSYTQFITNEQQSYIGDKDYIGGNNDSAPTLLFYLHHSKNITEAASMGKATIKLLSIRQVDALNKESKRLVITVNMSKVLFDTVNYEGAMTAGRKYELFTSSATNITSSSSISAYYSLFNSGASIYRSGYHRGLVSNYVLPLNTKITMIDLAKDTPEYYYHTITASDVTNAQTQLTTSDTVFYNLSMFETMGAVNSGVYYDDVAKNTSYCSTGNYCNEEYIFIIDFGDTQINADSLNNQLLIEIRDNDDEIIYSVLGPQHQDMVYNIYTNKDAIIDMDGTLDRNKIYNGETVIADMTIDYTQSTVGSTTIYDTHYFDSKLGMKISLINEDGDVVTGTTLLGLYYEIDGVRYYPNIDGTTRIKIADKVDSAEKWVIINTGTSKIASGNYTLRFESFGSPDGIYYGLNSSDTKDFAIEIVNEIYGLDVNTTPEEMIINSLTGKNANGEASIKFDIDYNSGLNNPSIHLKMYRRNYNTIDDTTYTLINAQDYFDNALVRDKEKEYIIIDNPNETNSVTFRTKSELITGTYRLEFILYDGSSAIGTVEKYIVIK